MAIEDIKKLTYEEIEERLSQIKTEIDSADAKKIEELNAEITAIEERKTVLKAELEQRKADMQAVIEGAGREIPRQGEERKTMTLEELRSSKRYTDAFADYIKYGNNQELRSMMTEIGSNTDGLVLPKVVSDEIERAWEEHGVISQLISKVEFKGYFSVPYEKSATKAAARAESAGAGAEGENKFGEVVLIPKMISKWITAKKELLIMSGEKFLKYVYAELAEKCIVEFETKIVENIISKSSLNTSFTNTDNKPFAEVVEAKAPFAAVLSAMAKLTATAKRRVAVMTSETYFDKIMTSVDTTGRPIYTMVTDNGSPTYYINGIEVVFNDAIGNDKIIVGDFNGYKANFPDGDNISVMVDPYSKAEDGIIKYVADMYVGHDITKPKYFAIAKITE